MIFPDISVFLLIKFGSVPLEMHYNYPGIPRGVGQAAVKQARTTGFLCARRDILPEQDLTGTVGEPNRKL